MLASSKDMHKSLNEFEFLSDPNTEFIQFSALERLKNGHIILWPLWRHDF